MNESFTARVPANQKLEVVSIPSDDNRTEVTMPAGVTLTRSLNAEQRVRLPANTELPEPQREGDTLAYTFPVKCEVRTKPVNPWDLGKVVGISVMGICLWGTLIGSMLPLVFKWQGIDPGLASSPFVATAVDVTGIAIFFSIASVWLL